MDNANNSKVSRIRALQEAFVGQLPARISAIDSKWASVLETENSEDISDLCHLLHSLAGSASTFGYPLIGDRARRAELLLSEAQSGAHLKKSIQGTITRDLEIIKDLSRRPPDEPQVVLAQRLDMQSDASRIYVLEDDAILGQQITEQLGHFGFVAETFENSDALIKRFREHAPAAVVADVIIGDNGLEGTETAARLHEIVDGPVPIIFISVRDDWTARLAAIRAGGQAYITKPLDFASLAEHLNHFMGTERDDPFRVLVLDDDQAIADHHVSVLESLSLKAEAVTQPEHLLARMRDIKPDVILVDLYMPDCSGVEVVNLLRQHPEYQHLPIVYLSSEQRLGNQLAAMQHGGDGFLSKPVDDRTLFTAVTIRAKRYREISKLVSRDSMTGLLNHINIKLELEREIARALRDGEPLSVAMLDLDLFKKINDTYGHGVGDYVIKSLSNLLIRRLRKSDIAGRYGGEEFAIILPSTNCDEAAALLNKLREDFASVAHLHANETFSITFSAGISAISADSTPRSALAAADDALYVAKADGRNCVRVHQS